MIQEPENYHILGDFLSYPNIFDEGHTFVVFDTETTGMAAEKERVIEIGAIKFDKNGIIDKFETLLNPQKRIAPFITNINHISNEMVKNAPTAEQIIPKFADFIKGCILIAHNAPFDLKFINHELIRLNMNTLQNNAIDTLRLTRWAYPKFGHWNQPFLAEQLNINVENAHRANDDSRVCLEIFLKTLEEIRKKTN